MIIEKNILIGICGSISAYKVLGVISNLLNRGFKVKVILTESAKNFITSESAAVISKNNLYVNDNGKTLHIDLAAWCDIFVIVPATYNTIGKLANGISDNLLTDTYAAIKRDRTSKRILLFPVMNTEMYSNCKNNFKKILTENHIVKIIEPIEGRLACGSMGKGKIRNSNEICDFIEIEYLKLSTDDIWFDTLPTQCKGLTTDSFSYLSVKSWEYEIPLYPHCGSFGAIRKHDRHKGIDLYAIEGTPVHAVETGEVMEICPFTGEKAGCDWWLDTEAIYIKGKSGIVVYGEITVHPNLVRKQHVVAGQVIGSVKRVLKADKGRPVSMLHLELHHEEFLHTETWIDKKPDGLKDPTLFLKDIVMRKEYFDKYNN